MRYLLSLTLCFLFFISFSQQNNPFNESVTEIVYNGYFKDAPQTASLQSIAEKLIENRHEFKSIEFNSPQRIKIKGRMPIYIDDTSGAFQDFNAVKYEAIKQSSNENMIGYVEFMLMLNDRYSTLKYQLSSFEHFGKSPKPSGGDLQHEKPDSEEITIDEWSLIRQKTHENIVFLLKEMEKLVISDRDY